MKLEQVCWWLTDDPLEGEAQELCGVAFGRGKELWKPINYLSAAIDHCRKDPASASEVTWTPRASLQPDGVSELKKVGGKEFGGPVYSIDCSDFALRKMLAKRRRRLTLVYT